MLIILIKVVNIDIYRLINKLFIIVLILIFPIKYLFIKKNKTENKKVLVIRLWALGDCINLLPIIKKLNSNGYSVDVLTTSVVKNIFSSQNFINNIILFDFKNPFNFFKLIKILKNNNYNIVIDTEQFMNISTFLGLFTFPKKFIGYNHLFRNNFFTHKVEYVEKRHFVENFATLLKPLGIDYKNIKLVPLSFNKSSIKKVDSLIKKYNNKNLVAIHLGTGDTAIGRRWSENKFAKLINQIDNDKTQIILTGLDAEAQIYDRIKLKLKLTPLILINKLNLSDFTYLLSKLDVFIANDTGPMHMAASMQTKVIGLFGMNNPQKVGAWPIDKNINIYKNPNGEPIINNKYSIYPSDDCSTIDLIKVGDVLMELRKMLK